MEDAWPENSVFSNPSAGYSPMDIDAKISQKIVPKSANEEEPKSKLYEMVLQKLGKMGMSDDKFGNVEMAKGNQGNKFMNIFAYNTYIESSNLSRPFALNVPKLAQMKP